MKILLATFEYPPYPLAGTGLYAVNLVKNLKNHEVTVITPYHGLGEKHEKTGNITVNRIDVVGLRFLPSKVNRSFIDKRLLFALTLKKYLKTLDLKEYDLFHCLNVQDANFFDYNLLNKYFNVLVSVNEDYIISSSLNPFKFPFKSTDLPIRYIHHNILKQFNKKTLRKANRIIANSFSTKRNIAKFCKIDENKIDVVHRGIDIEKFDIRIDKEKYHSHKILFVGPNLERKGGLYVIKALPIILKEFPDSTLTMVGSCSFIYKKLIEKEVIKNSLKNKIEFIDHVSQEKLLPLYKEANVFVMPSIIEALGQVYMEAMMCKTPVIGANVGGVPEIITDDVGFLVKPKDYKQIAEFIIQIFKDPKKSGEVGKIGKERILRYFNLDKMIKETIDIYEKYKK